MSRALETQDEVLQVLYWMRGEGLGDEVPAEQLLRFLQLDVPELATALAQLQARGLLEDTNGKYRLTPRGEGEGARRFREEFSPYLGKDSHLSCSDPSCDCHTSQSPADCPAHAHDH